MSNRSQGRWNISYVLTLLCLFFFCAQTKGQQFSLEDMKGQEELSKALSKKGALGGIWFGPRVGKRSHPSPLGVPLHRLLSEVMADPKHYFDDYSDLRANSIGTKRRFTPRLGRESGEQSARAVDFIPRLGRELTPELLAAIAAAAADDDFQSEILYGRSTPEDRLPIISKAPPFAPRLGREFAELYGQDLFASKDGGVRVERSASELRIPKKSHHKA